MIPIPASVDIEIGVAKDATFKGFLDFAGAKEKPKREEEEQRRETERVRVLRTRDDEDEDEEEGEEQGERCLAEEEIAPAKGRETVAIILECVSRLRRWEWRLKRELFLSVYLQLENWLLSRLGNSNWGSTLG